MKKHAIFFLLLFLLPLGGCFNELETNLNMLERRIEKLEQRCREMNTTLDGLRSIVDKLNQYDFLTNVESNYLNGKIIGYTLHFAHSNPVTLYNGTDAETPVLGVRKGEDGIWYWTVKYPSDREARFLTDNYGVRIPTSAASPQFKIENAYWMVTYDGGEIWHNLGRATGEDGMTFVQNVEDKGDYIVFTLHNGTSVQLPTWASFEKLQETCRKVNENLETFRKLVAGLGEKVRVSEMIPILSGQDTIGVTLSLTDGKSYSFYNGSGTNAPVIGARKDGTGEVWYWTIRYGEETQWILDERGQRIQANAPQGLSPKISLLKDSADDTWYWAVAYGDQAPVFLRCNGERVAASVSVPNAVIQSIVSVRDDQVCITLDGGQTVYIPLAKALTVSLSAPVVDNKLTMGAKDTVSFTCSLSRSDERAEVLPVAADDFYATATTADHKDWTVVVVSPKNFSRTSTSRLNILVSNGYGALKTVVVTIQGK